ncbi:cytochrome P450 6k1-like [Battus philenor]|uniref:cytochrome P450 6k1-like n=1 Tax=Battus philenor TaxID=42288 RepID=UPI0035D00DB2
MARDESGLWASVYFQVFLKLFICALVFGFLWLLKKWHRTKNFWKNRNVRSSPPHPVLGSLRFLLRQNPGLWMRDNYDRRDPYFGVWWFWRPALVINSPEIARQVLIRDAGILRDRFLSSGKSDPIGSLNLFLGNDPIWSLMRRHVSPMFTSSKLKIFQRHLVSKSKDLVRRIGIEMETDKRVNLRVMFTDYTTDVVGIVAFGVESDATLSGESALRKITKGFMKFSYIRGLAWACIFFCPELVDVFGFSFFPKSAIEYFRYIFKAVVKQRGGYETEIGQTRDFLDALRKVKQDCIKNNEDMPEDVLIAQAVAFLQGGFDTTGTALSFCVYELAYHPTVQDKIYNELKPIKDQILDDDFNLDVLNQMNYLKCALKESIRKYPPMGWIDRVASTDYKINENLTVPAGTPIYVNSIGMHYDPEYFPDPFKFDPERFLPENEKNIKPYTYLPFGEGPRACVGRRFAEQNVYCVLANILINYKIVPKPGAPLPRDIQVEKKGLFFIPGENLYVDFIPRNN